jgi:aldose 1-epimerase
MSATSNKKTVVSFTQHPYFNLGGINLPDLAEHQLQISADHYLPINEMFIPTGELSPVGNSPFDFRSINDINSKLGDDHPQLIRAKGFDHCFVKTGVDELFAHLVHAKNGRSLRVFSNAPGLQLYTSNFLNGPYPGKHGKIYKPRQAICLEPQAFPNAPRESNFPAAVLGVNEKYEHHMVYKFGVVDV